MDKRISNKEIKRLQKCVEQESLKNFLVQAKKISVYETGNEKVNKIFYEFFRLIKKSEKMLK